MDEGGQVVIAERDARADAQDAALVAVGHFPFHPVKRIDDVDGVCVHAPSAFGYIEPLIEPLKQADTVVLFHLTNASGNGGLGHIEVFRRTGDVHRSADLQKDAHMADGHGAFLRSYQIGYRYNKRIAFYTSKCKG